MIESPWKVFTTPDGRKLVGIGAEDGQGILDCGFGVWAWNDAEGIANAALVVKAVNNHDALVKALEDIAAMDPKGIRADDLGRAARIASEAIRTLVAGKKQP